MTDADDAVTDNLGAVLSRRITLALSVLHAVQDGVPTPVRVALQMVVDILTGELDQ